MGQWEYKLIATIEEGGKEIVDSVDNIRIVHRTKILAIDALNELGKDGWELVQIIPHPESDGSEYILKRFIVFDYVGSSSSTLAILRNPYPIPE